MYHIPLLLVVLMSAQETMVTAEEPYIDTMEWAQLIDQNLLTYYVNYLRKIGIELDSDCAEKLSVEVQYATCYKDNIARWQNTRDESKLACCFLIDYEYCLVNLVDNVCGRASRNNLERSQRLRMARKQLDDTLNCKKDGYQDIYDCRMPSWGIIVISVVLCIILVGILAWIYFWRR